MGLLLKILGIIFIVILLLVFYLVLYLRKWWKKIKSSEDDSSGVPVRIHLNEDLDPQWVDTQDVQALVNEFKNAGFIKGKAYNIPEMPQVRLISLFTGQAVSAVIYKHDQGLCWSDIVVSYEDGTDLTVSNAPSGGELDCRPESKKITKPGAAADDLYATFKAEMKSKPMTPINDGNFRQRFEESYQRDMEWRMGKGGTSEEEFQRIADKSKTKLDKDQIHEAFIESKRKELNTWHDACLEYALEKKVVPKEKRDSFKQKCFIVSDNMHPEAFLEYLDEHMDITETAKGNFKKLLPNIQKTKDFFYRINETFSPDLQAKKIGHVNQPIPAEIYKSPLS